MGTNQLHEVARLRGQNTPAEALCLGEEPAMAAGPLVLAALLCASPLLAATYVVDGRAPNASDTNAGSEEAPWRTISRAGSAAELKPGDTVLVRAGVYREHVSITVSGAPGDPITFAAAPGAKVVIKGSEIVRGPWTKLSEDEAVAEPFPNAFSEVWRAKLGDEYFADPYFVASYEDPAKRWVSAVFLDDHRALQRIGADPIYPDVGYPRLATVGRDQYDLIDDSFYFDPTDQSLYLKIAGDPAWFAVEIGVRGFGLTINKVHDLVIRGLEVRHNRQPGGQWPMVSVGECERVIIEDCKIYQADFCGLGLGRSRSCTIRRCDLSYNGDTGLGMGECEDCTIEDCTLLFNNTRRFRSGWHAGGAKCIPTNRRCTIQRCEAAYNIASDGIWFDSDNSDIRILDNVSHHNGGCGIFFEINKGGGIIANNLVYANHGRGIYLSGSQKTWVVHNTVAGNDGGIVCMPREGDWTLEDVHVLNNLLLGNYVTADTLTRGCDLTLYMGPDPDAPERTVTSNHSDYNIYANTSWAPTLRQHWNPDNPLDVWQQRYGEDLHSRLLPVDFVLSGTGFELRTAAGLDGACELPERLNWRPPVPGRIGSTRTRWPAGAM